MNDVKAVAPVKALKCCDFCGEFCEGSETGEGGATGDGSGTGDGSETGGGDEVGHGGETGDVVCFEVSVAAVEPVTSFV